MGPSAMNFGTIEGGTQLSTVADFYSIKMDRRYVPGETVESVIKEYEDVLNGIAADDPDFMGRNHQDGKRADEPLRSCASHRSARKRHCHLLR